MPHPEEKNIRTPASLVLIVLALAALVPFLLCCGSAEKGLPPVGPQPVLLIGLDGASPDVVSRLIEGGRLPNLGGLVNEGRGERLQSYRPTVSPLIWSSMATGKAWHRLGIHPVEMRRGLRGARLGPAPIWRIASSRGRRVAVLNWWLTSPAGPVNGHLLSDRSLYFFLRPGEALPRARLTHPPEWIGELAGLRREMPGQAELVEAFGLEAPALAGTGERPGGAAHLTADGADAHPELLEHLGRDEVVVQAALEVLGRERPDLTAVYLRTIDICQHAFWPDPGGPAEATANPLIAGAYAHADRLVGELVEAFRKWSSDGLVIVVSDHGASPRSELFSPDIPPDLDPRLVLGVLGLNRIRAGGRNYRVSAVDVYAFSPELFFVLEEEQGEGRAGGEGETREGTTGTPVAGRIAGAPPVDALERFAALLSAVRTADGKPLFLQVRPSEDMAWCHVRADVNPELRNSDTLDRDAGLMPLSALGLVRRGEGPSGQHLLAPDGIIIAAGPGVAPAATSSEEAADEHRLFGGAARMRVLDVAPTILCLLGIPPARDMDGRPYTELMGRRFPRFPESEWAESYDHPAAARGGAARGEGEPQAEPPQADSDAGDADSAETEDESALSPIDEQRVEEFKALGYIE